MPYEHPGSLHNLTNKATPSHSAVSPSVSGVSPATNCPSCTLTGCVREVSCEDETVRCVSGSNFMATKSLVPISGVSPVGPVGSPPVVC